MKTPKGDNITVFDLRFTQPNVSMLPEKGIHTLEHLFAGLMRQCLNDNPVEIIDISPMGCRTGFYMSLIGQPQEQQVVEAWIKSMQAILTVVDQHDIPELNRYQCGSFKMHSLLEAKAIAEQILAQGITICRNNDILLSDEHLKQLSSS